MKLITSIENVPIAVSSLRERLGSKAKVSLCHGVFDLVHLGHLEHFNQAKSQGEILVVSVTSDRYVNKGPERPYFSEFQRIEFLGALEIVDLVFICDSESSIPAIEYVKPDFYFKGPDYRNMSDDITGKIYEEKRAVELNGGQLVFTEGFTSSSTKLINSSLAARDSELRNWVAEYRKKFSITETLSWVDKLGKVSLGVLGESIIDAYTATLPLAKSSKDPILAFQRLSTERYLGGVWAVADSCSEWAQAVKVFTVTGGDFLELDLLNENEVKYEVNCLTDTDRPSILKHRFVDQLSGNRVFEYYEFKNELIPQSISHELWKSICEQGLNSALILVADYGHEIFTHDLIDRLCNSNSFLAVNTQANAGNRGFNTFNKYSRIDFLSLNGGELQLELRNKQLQYQIVVPQIMKEKKCKNVVVTLGASGMLVFGKNGEFCEVPAFASKVVDKVGAGDSVLAISSMLSYLDAPKEVIALLASIVAAHEVGQLGHRSALSAASMKKSILGLLG